MAKGAKRAVGTKVVDVQVMTDADVTVGAGIQVGIPDLVAAKVTERKFMLTQQQRKLERERAKLRAEADAIHDKVRKNAEAIAVATMKDFWSQVEKVCKGLGAKLDRPKNADEEARMSLKFSLETGCAVIMVRAGSSSVDKEEAVEVSVQRKYNLWDKSFDAPKKEFEKLQQQISQKTDEIAEIKVALSDGPTRAYADDLTGQFSMQAIAMSGEKGQALVRILDSCAGALEGRLLDCGKK